MKFGYIVEELLNELSGDEIHQKYYSDIPPNTFWTIVSADPQTIRTDNGSPKMGRYAKILLNMFKSGKLKMEDLPRAKDYLTIAYKYKVPLDSNKIRNLTDIFNLVKRYIARDTNDFDTVLNTIPSKEYKQVLDGVDWMIFIPYTERAACSLGGGTDWCTTWGKHSLNKSHTDRQNHYSQYASQGSLYILVSKEAPEIKYQFHFETKQFMNRYDAEIDTIDFLNTYPEIKKFFFPSLYRNASPEEMKGELSRMDILDSKDSMIIIKKYVGEDVPNPLARAILTNDEDLLSKLIVDDNLFKYYDITVEKGKLNFAVNKIPMTAKQVKDTITSFETEKHYSLDNLYENLSYEYDHEKDWKEVLEPIFKEYYNDEAYSIETDLGISDYESFKRSFFDNFYNDEKIQTEYISRLANLTVPNYDAVLDAEVRKIERHISFDEVRDGAVIMMPVVFVIQYILERGISHINGNLDDIIDEYCDYFNLPTEYYYDANFEYIYPTYEDGPMARDVKEHFEYIFHDVDNAKSCAQLRHTLNNVVDKIFKGSNEFENEHVQISLLGQSINCANGTVKIRYTNKDSGKSFSGEVKVDNLASYATNYKLFETIFTFKKNIL